MPLNHISALDGLRAFAIILVLFRHGVIFFLHQQGIDHAPEGDYLLRIFVNGWVGVDLFFVLSGFLISRSFFSGHRPPLKVYLYKRALRIIPAYYAVLALCVLGAFPFYSIASEELGFRVFYHALFLQDYLRSDINVVFWSLGVEEKFYLLAPFIMMAVMRLYQTGRMNSAMAVFAPLIVTGIAARCLSYYLAGSPEVYVDFFVAARSPFHACLEPLVIGMMIAFAERLAVDKVRDIKAERARIIFYGGFGAILLLMASSEFMAEIGWYDAALQPFLIALAMGAMVLGAVFGGAPCFLSARPLRFVAKISYALYLVHLPLWPLSYALLRSAPGEAVDMTLLPLFLVVFFAISGLAAYALYMLIERPFLQIKDILAKKSP